MKVAVVHKNGCVFGHFGQTEEFKIYEIENHAVIKSEVIGTEGNSHIQLIPFLVSKDVQIVLAGGIGDHAVQILSENGIKVFPGCKGLADKVVDDLLNDKLSYSEDAIHKCSGHH